MKKTLLKFTALFLIIGLNWFGLSTVGQTWAYFNDTEDSTGNIYSAGLLDFSLINTDIEELIGVELGEDIEFLSIAVKTTDSFDIQYRAKAEKMSGSNDDFCDALKMEALHSQISHDDSLLSFNTATTTAFGTWSFEIELPFTATHIPHGVECNVDLVFEGWQTDVEDYGDGGFSDEERIHLRLTSRMVVLNEFLPRPDGVAYGFDFGNDSSNMPQGEWVEVYNNSDYNFDLAGWYIKDADSNILNIAAVNSDNNGDTGDAGETIVPSSGHLVVYDNSNFSLNNDGDTVKLFDNSNNLIDSYAYTGHDYCELEPTPGDDNSYTTGSGSCGSVPPNKSYARIPDGIGTWVDPIPTPGRMNILEGEEENNWVELTPEEQIIQLSPEEGGPVLDDVILDDDVVLSDDNVVLDDPSVILNDSEGSGDDNDEVLSFSDDEENNTEGTEVDEAVDEAGEIDEIIEDIIQAVEDVVEDIIQEIEEMDLVGDFSDEDAGVQDENEEQLMVDDEGEEEIIEEEVEEVVEEEIIEEEPIIIDEETFDETNDEINEDE